VANNDLVPLPRADVIQRVSEAKTLLGRGLSSIKHGAFGLTIEQRDALYRDVRTTYNVLTDDGNVTFFGDVGIDPEVLLRVHKVFQDLADVGYGKAYWPLAIFYEGGKAVIGDAEKARKYNRLAFDWCFSNQHIEDPEIWNDLAVQYMRGKRVPDLFHIPQERRIPPSATDVREALVGDGDSDLQAALFWFRKAGDYDYGPAIFNLAEMHWDGRGVCEDHEKAIELQLLAAEAGHATAQWGLAVQHSTWITTAPPSQHIEWNDEIAIQWAFKAAKQGHGSARRLFATKVDATGISELESEEFPVREIGVNWRVRFRRLGKTGIARDELISGIRKGGTSWGLLVFSAISDGTQS